MPNVILALLTRPEAAAGILAGAERLGVLLGGARIEALVMRVPPISTILVTEEILSKADEARIRGREAARAAALRAVFDEWGARYGGAVAPRWVDEEGMVEALVKEWGQRADYIVAGKPAAYGEHEVLHAALFGTDRPVLMLPPGAGAFGRCIAIAWREDAFTIHAVLAALRCMARAERIHVLMGRRAGAAVPEIPAVLVEHDVTVTGHEIALGQGVFGAALLAQAHGLGADMLVMGAFVHSAWRNMLFGGVTGYVLANSDLPVLMRH